MKASSYLLLFSFFFLGTIPEANALRTDCSAQMVVLDENNNFIESSVSYEIRFYENENPTSGEIELATAVDGTGTPTDGLLDITFDCQINLLAASDTVYMEVDLNGETLSPRTEMNSVPFAALAGSLVGDSGQAITFIGGDLEVDGSGIISIVSNAVALGTDTTGNYVASLTAGTGISITGGTGEGSTPTIASTITGLSADAVTATEIAAGAVGTSEIADGSVAVADLANDSVTSAKIVDGTITNGDINNNTLDFDKISDDLTLDSFTNINLNSTSIAFRMDSALVSERFYISDRTGLIDYFRLDPNAGISFSTNASNLLTATDITFSINLSNTQSSQRLCHNGVDGGATLVNIGDCDGAQADLAELYGSEGDLVPGDVVIFDGPGFLLEDKNQKSISKAYLTKSNQAYDKQVMGVVSTNPSGELLGEGIFDESENPVPLALVGRVPVNVSNKNGAIHTGDYLTSSDIPGYAMKATKPGPTIGIALEDFNEPRGQILLFIKDSGYPSEGNNSQGQLTIEKEQQEIRISLDQDLTEKSVVSVTPLDNPGCFFWIEKGKNFFTLKLSQKASQNIRFDWLVSPSH